MLPGGAAIGRLVDAVANGEIRPTQALTTADINDVWIRWRNRERADRAGRLIVKNWFPRATVVGSLPHTTVVRSHVKNVGPFGDSRNRDSAARAKRTDHSPAKFLIERWMKLLGNNARAQKEHRTNNTEERTNQLLFHR